MRVGPAYLHYDHYASTLNCCQVTLQPGISLMKCQKNLHFVGIRLEHQAALRVPSPSLQSGKHRLLHRDRCPATAVPSPAVLQSKMAPPGLMWKTMSKEDVTVDHHPIIKSHHKCPIMLGLLNRV